MILLFLRFQIMSWARSAVSGISSHLTLCKKAFPNTIITSEEKGEQKKALLVMLSSYIFIA